MVFVVLTLVAVGGFVMEGVVVVVMVAVVVVESRLALFWWRLLLTLECVILPMLRWLCITQVLTTRRIAELQLHNAKTIQNKSKNEVLL